MSARRELALKLLASIQAKLTRDKGEALHTVRLTSEERRYLLGVCARALKGERDPLSIGKGAGGQSKFAEGLAEAKLVHERIAAGESLRAACEAVAKSIPGRIESGGPRGAVEKNYEAHKERILANRRIHAHHAGKGSEPLPGDVAAVFREKDPRK